MTRKAAVALKEHPPVSQAATDLPPGARLVATKNGTPAIEITDGPMNHLARAGGSKVPSFNGFLFKEVLAAVRPQGTDPDEQARCLAAVYAALAAL